MSSEELEPDAWATFSDTYRVMDDLDADEEYLIVEDDTHKEPLFSAQTIQNQLEKSKIENPNKFGNQEERQQALHWNKKIREMIEVFSNEQ